MTKYSDYEQDCFIYAARYAHMRNTGASLSVISVILANWHRFADEAQRKIVAEAKTALYNKEEWQILIDKLEDIPELFPGTTEALNNLGIKK